MFWLFKPHEQSVENTLTLWLNGGPGCSSFNCGVMMENSPVTQPLHDAGYCCLQPTPDLSYNNYSWTRATTMLYVEQPIGTGFSRGHPLPENEHDVASDLYEFMQNFYSVFTELSTYEFFVMGESYAGMVRRWLHVDVRLCSICLVLTSQAAILYSLYLQSLATFICKIKKRIVLSSPLEEPPLATVGWTHTFKALLQSITPGGMALLMSPLAMRFMLNGTIAWRSVRNAPI